MTNDLKQAVNYIQNVVEWVSLTKGEEALKSLTNEDVLKQTMIEYNQAYEKFVEKFINSKKDVKDIIAKKMCGDVYFKIRTQSEFDTLHKNNRECLNMIEA